MRAMVLDAICRLEDNQSPLTPAELPVPAPGPGEVRLRVSVCGVCHTDLDEIEGRMPPPRLPVVLGHQVVGTVDALGPGAAALQPGDRVGVAWIWSACGRCKYCLAGLENLCPEFRATGRDANGGYAEFMTVPAAFAHPLPDGIPDVEAAPLLCAGAIGYRSLALSGISDGQALGLTGFGASAHLVLKMVRHRFPAARRARIPRPRRRDPAAPGGAALRSAGREPRPGGAQGTADPRGEGGTGVTTPILSNAVRNSATVASGTGP